MLVPPTDFNILDVFLLVPGLILKLVAIFSLDYELLRADGVVGAFTGLLRIAGFLAANFLIWAGISQLVQSITGR